MTPDREKIVAYVEPRSKNIEINNLEYLNIYDLRKREENAIISPDDELNILDIDERSKYPEDPSKLYQIK